MARKKNEVTVIEQTEMPEQVATLMNEAHNDQYDRAVALAGSLGYQGAVTVDALEGEIRFYQRRSVEAILEVGKRLLVLKELTPHGEFSGRVQDLGISWRTANRFMQAATKTSKFANLANLSKEVRQCLSGTGDTRRRRGFGEADRAGRHREDERHAGTGKTP